jgi:hypothetical protein
MIVLQLFTAWAVCDEVRTERLFTSVQTAYLQNVEKEVRQQTWALTEATRCGDPSNRQLHRVHLAHGLYDLMRSRPTVATRFATAVAALPTAQLPGDLARDPRVGLAFARAQERSITWTRVPAFERDGANWQLQPDLPLELPKKRGTTLLVGAVATGVIAAGLYGAAWGANRSYQEVKGGEQSVVLPRYRLTNGLAMGAAVAGVASVSMFTVTLVR